MNQSPAQTSKNLGLGPMESVVLVVVSLFLALSLLFFLAGQMAGLIFKAHWPDAPFSSFPGVTGRIVSNPGSPADAWPQSAEGQVPGPVLYYITLILLIVAGLAIAKGLHYLWTGAKRKDQNNAQWARARDIKTLIVPHSGIRGRLVLGRSNGKMIATEPRQSVIVMGPTQTGKTTGFAVPAILEWDGPVIAASVKNDLVKDTYKWRRTQGEVWLFDPTRSTGYDYEDVRGGWSPLSQAIDWGGARKVASWLCKANKQAGGGLSDGDFWFSAAEKMMSPYLFAAAVGGKDMATVLRWIDVNEEREVLSILERAGVPEALTAFQANMGRDERTKSSIFTTAETIVDAYNDPLVCESAANPTIFPSELLNGGKNTLYICAPSHEQERLQAIFTAIVAQMKSSAYELAGKQNHPVDPPLLICIDEAANIAPLSDLDAIASTAAGIGIQLVTIFQDMAQIEARYKEKARTVVNNHRAKVILSGISDTGTLEYVSKLCGEEEIDQQSTSVSAQGERSTTDSKSQRTLASGAYLRRMKFGEGIVVYGQLSPAKLVLRQWFKDRVLKHMVEFGTKPGVEGGPQGSNSFSEGSGISKDATLVPAISSVASDARMASGSPGNQSVLPADPFATPAAGTSPPAGTSTAPGGEPLSAFDKALAELRARDASAGVPSADGTVPPVVPGSVPTSLGTPAVSPTPAQYTPGTSLLPEPEPEKSPSKWKPSGGGVVDSSSDDAAGGSTSTFAPAPAAVPEVPPAPPEDPYGASKWAKGSRPKFSEPAPTSTVPPAAVVPPVIPAVPSATSAVPPVIPTVPPVIPAVPPVPPTVVPPPVEPRPTTPGETSIPLVSDLFSQYEEPPQVRTDEYDSDTPSGSESPKSKWK